MVKELKDLLGTLDGLLARLKIERDQAKTEGRVGVAAAVIEELEREMAAVRYLAPQDSHLNERATDAEAFLVQRPGEGFTKLICVRWPQNERIVPLCETTGPDWLDAAREILLRWNALRGVRDYSAVDEVFACVSELVERVEGGVATDTPVSDLVGVCANGLRLAWAKLCGCNVGPCEAAEQMSETARAMDAGEGRNEAVQLVLAARAVVEQLDLDEQTRRAEDPERLWAAHDDLREALRPFDHLMKARGEE